jgi:hypothetical protein
MLCSRANIVAALVVITGSGPAIVALGGSPGVLEKGHATVVESGLVDPLAWVCEQGVVLQSARGPVPNLAEQIAGESIRGSWWGHASGHEIFAVLSGLRASGDVVATRLIEGRVTLVHRRIWPALSVLLIASLLSGSQLLTSSTLPPGPTGSSRLRSRRGSRLKTLPQPRFSASTKRSRSFPSACAEDEAAGMPAFGGVA